MAYHAIKCLWNIEKLTEVTTDQLYEAIGKEFDSGQVAGSLATLERLGCITITMCEIHINETIVVQKST